MGGCRRGRRRGGGGLRPPSGYGVVYLETHPRPWDFSRAPILRELSRHVPVLMIHPVPARRGYVAALAGLLRRGRLAQVETLEAGRFQSDATGLLPGGRFARVAAMNEGLLARHIRRAMRAVGIERGALWFAQPGWRQLAESLAGSLLPVYDCTDLYTAMPGLDATAATAVADDEARLARSADVLCLAVSRPLAGHLKQLGASRVHHLPHGFDEPERDQAESLIAAVPRPILGLVGRLNARQDYDLLESLAERFQDCSLLLAGEIEAADGTGRRIARLRRRTNVRVTGTLSRSQARAVAGAVDLGLIAYLDSPLNRHCDPVKMYDHLGGSVPVVATDVADLGQAADLVRVAAGPDAFLDAVSLGLAQPLDPAALRGWQVGNSNRARAGELRTLLLAQEGNR